ncbi:MAG: hypothetical protein RL654_3611 [Pseudomonadota bacterium]|jgi:hypothetical protein
MKTAADRGNKVRTAKKQLVFAAAVGAAVPDLRTVRGRLLMRVVEAAGHALIEMGPAGAPADGAAEACFVRLSTPPGLKDAIGCAFRDYAKWW